MALTQACPLDVCRAVKKTHERHDTNTRAANRTYPACRVHTTKMRGGHLVSSSRKESKKKQRFKTSQLKVKLPFFFVLMIIEAWLSQKTDRCGQPNPAKGLEKC